METAQTHPTPPITARAAYLAIGLTAYAGFHGVFLWMISFLNGGPVPFRAETTTTLPLALAINAGWVVLFGVQHAVMARPAFKARWTRIVPVPIERSLFVVATVVCLSLALTFWQTIPGALFTVSSEPMRIALYALQAAGWGILVWSTFLIDHFELFGVKQVVAAFRSRALPVQQFRMPALYRFSRHPMMVGMLIGLWATPDMTWDRLTFALGFSLYVVVGVRMEERDLVRNLGDDYRQYQATVGRFLSWPGRRKTRGARALAS